MAQPVWRSNRISREPVLAGAGYSNNNRKTHIFSNGFINGSEYDSHSESRAASQDGMGSEYSVRGSGSYRNGRPNVMYAGYAGTTGNAYEGSFGGNSFAGHTSGSVSGSASRRNSANGNSASAQINKKQNSRTQSVRTPDIGTSNKAAAPSVSLGDLSAEREHALAVSAQRKKAATKKRKAVRIVKAAEVRPVPVTFIFMAVIATVLLMFIIYNLVSLNEMTIKLSESQSMLTELMKTEKELSLKLELKNDLLEIERIATEEYGMVKNDKVVKQYINIEGEDKIEVIVPQNVAESRSTALPESEVDNKDGGNGVFSNVMSAFGQRFESLLEAIN